MFIRTKKIKTYSYAYLVENSWKKQSSRQKVKEYLGRVYEFGDTAIKDHPSLAELSFTESVRTLATAQVSAYGFTETVLDGNTLFAKDELLFDPKTFSFYHSRTKKPYVIKSFDGHLCTYTLKTLSEFNPEGMHEEQMGYELARAFIAAGFHLPKELFVELFVKIRPVQIAQKHYTEHPK